MKNYLKAPNVVKLPNCLPTHFKNPTDEIFYVNCILGSLDVHFSSKHDSMTKHTIYVKEVCDAILLLPKYLPEIDPAYFLALEESIVYLEKFWDKDKKELMSYLQKVAIAFEAASDYYGQNRPKNLTEEKAKAIERFSVLAKAYVKKSIKLRKASGKDIKRKPYLLILKELNEEVSKLASGTFMRACFQQKAIFYQQAYDNLFENSVLGLGWVSSIFSRTLHLANLNLTGVILEKKNFKGAELSKVNLREAVLSAIILENATLSEVNLRNADLKHANLKGATFIKRVNLREADFTNANLENAKFNQVNLKGVCFRGANLRGVSFNEVVLDEADFSGADLTGTSFKCVDLKRANLRGVQLKEVRLDGINFSGTNLTDASLNGYSLEELVKEVMAKKWETHSSSFWKEELDKARSNVKPKIQDAESVYLLKKKESPASRSDPYEGYWSRIREEEKKGAMEKFESFKREFKL